MRLPKTKIVYDILNKFNKTKVPSLVAKIDKIIENDFLMKYLDKYAITSLLKSDKLEDQANKTKMLALLEEKLN